MTVVRTGVIPVLRVLFKWSDMGKICGSIAGGALCRPIIEGRALVKSTVNTPAMGAGQRTQGAGQLQVVLPRGVGVGPPVATLPTGEMVERLCCILVGHTTLYNNLRGY